MCVFSTRDIPNDVEMAIDDDAYQRALLKIQLPACIVPEIICNCWKQGWRIWKDCCTNLVRMWLWIISAKINLLDRPAMWSQHATRDRRFRIRVQAADSMP